MSIQNSHRGEYSRYDDFLDALNASTAGALASTGKSQLVSDYSFDASSGVVTINEMFTNVVLVINATDGIILYNPADATKGGTVIGTTLNLELDTTAMSDGDLLFIVVEIPEVQSVEDVLNCMLDELKRQTIILEKLRK